MWSHEYGERSTAAVADQHDLTRVALGNQPVRDRNETPDDTCGISPGGPVLGSTFRKPSKSQVAWPSEIDHRTYMRANGQIQR